MITKLRPKLIQPVTLNSPVFVSLFIYLLIFFLFSFFQPIRLLTPTKLMFAGRSKDGKHLLVMFLSNLITFN